MTIETTTNSWISGKDITENCGYVSANGSMRSDYDPYYVTLSGLKADCYHNLEKEAYRKGANAIINLTETEKIVHGIWYVEIRGIAVKIKPTVYKPSVEPEKKAGRSCLVNFIIIFFLFPIITILCLILLAPMLGFQYVK